MAISNITIYQDNKVGDSNLMPVHSPLVFLVDVTYSGTSPDYIYCKLYEGATLLNTFKCIPYIDVSVYVRRFMFIANGILQGYMNDFDDEIQSTGSLVHIENITKEFTLGFSDPDSAVSDVELDIVAAHGVRQFGQYPNMDAIYNNDTETIIAFKNKPCYVYFYNNSTINTISLIQNFGIRFVITDSIGFLNLVSVTINGVTKYTNTSGEVFFELVNDNYNYEIVKYGYVTVSDSVTVNSNIVIINLEMTPRNLVSVTFHAEYSGSDIQGALITIMNQSETTIIDSGYTDVNGDYQINLYEDTYRILVSELPYYLVVDDHDLIVSGVTIDNLTIYALDVWNVKFIVKDSLGNPIENAGIGAWEYVNNNDPTAYFGHQTAILFTDVNGEVTCSEVDGTYSYGATKAGYFKVGGNVAVNGADIIKNIILPK